MGGELYDLSDFQRGQIVAARLAGVSVTKISESFNVSRGTLLTMMAAYTEYDNCYLGSEIVGVIQS